jgi:hypothetical protein
VNRDHLQKSRESERPMNRETDIHHRWVAWSEADQADIARRPDLCVAALCKRHAPAD